MNLLTAVNQVFETTDQPPITTGGLTLPEARRCVSSLNEAVSTVWARIPMDLKPTTTELLEAQPNVSEYALTALEPTRVHAVYDVAAKSYVNMASPTQGMLDFYGQTSSVSVWYVLNNKLFLSPAPTTQVDYLVTGEMAMPVLSDPAQELPFPQEFHVMLVAYARWKILSFLQEPMAPIEYQVYDQVSKRLIDRLYEQGPTYLFNTNTQPITDYLNGR